MRIHAEIEYINKDGKPIHSDICPTDCDFEKMTDAYKKNLHDYLDEWLNSSNGTGGFYIKENCFKFDLSCIDE